MPPVIREGVVALIDGITLPDSGKPLFLKGETAELGTTVPSQALKGYLSGRLGDLLTVRLVEVLSPEKLLLEMAGTQVVAKGSLPSESATFFTVRLESLDPVVRFSLVDQAESALPLQLRRIMSAVVAKPNLFAKELIFLKDLLLDKSIHLPASVRNDLKSLTTRFSAASLIAGLRSGDGMPLTQLGLFHEQGLADSWFSDPEKITRLALQEPLTSKESLLRLLTGLEGSFTEKIFQEMGAPESKIVAKLHSVLRSMLDLVELNQCLNNPGLRSDDGFVLMLPLWGWNSAADLWLRLSRDGEAKTGGRDLYTLMIYLDLEGLGPLGAQVVASPRELQVKLMAVGEDAAQSLRELLPEARAQLRSRFPGGVRLSVESIGSNGVEEFRQRAFLASLPSLFTASG